MRNAYLVYAEDLPASAYTVYTRKTIPRIQGADDKLGQTLGANSIQ